MPLPPIFFPSFHCNTSLFQLYGKKFLYICIVIWVRLWLDFKKYRIQDSYSVFYSLLIEMLSFVTAFITVL